MLKRNGQKTEHDVPGLAGMLTRSELDAYTGTFQTIKPEFEELAHISRQLGKLTRTSTHLPESPSETNVTIRASGIEWQVQARLLKLAKSEILLCRNSTRDEFAVAQRFPEGTAYAKANGRCEILLKGNDPRQLVREYIIEAHHTLRFMASNLVAKAQQVVWERFAEHNPGKVVRALSKRCQHVVGYDQSVTETESLNRTTRGIRV